MVAGVQKSGTTALAKFLTEHPRLGLSKKKEIHFFDRNDLYLNGNEDAIHSYHEEFDGCVGDIWCDATPAYCYFPEAVERIYRYNPEAKLIMALRNPVERAYSHYVMMREFGLEKLPFSAAVKLESERIGPRPWEDLDGPARNFNYVDRGRYARMLEDLWNRFPREQTLILLQDDLLDQHEATLSKVWDFLGVEHVPVAPAKHFSTAYDRPMSEAARNYVQATLADQILQTGHLLGRNLSGWLN